MSSVRQTWQPCQLVLTSSPGLTIPMNAAAMPSVAPTVIRVSVDHSQGMSWFVALCRATACRSSGMPSKLGYWLLYSYRAFEAICKCHMRQGGTSCEVHLLLCGGMGGHNSVTPTRLSAKCCITPAGTCKHPTTGWTARVEAEDKGQESPPPPLGFCIVLPSKSCF